jgi:hypothetical protein
MLAEMDAKNGSSLSAQSELGTQLVAIYFFDYYLQNRVKPQLGDLSAPDISEDLDMFLRGSVRRMQAHPLFGPSGTKRWNGLGVWIENQQSWYGTNIGVEDYRSVFGIWFLREMGDIMPMVSCAQKAGRILQASAADIYLADR